MKKTFALLLVCALFIVSAVTVGADAPKNQLLNTKWTKAMGKVEVSEKNVGGEKITTMSGMDSSFASAAIDIMPTIEKLMGDNDEIDIWIVLDVESRKSLLIRKKLSTRLFTGFQNVVFFLLANALGKAQQSTIN